MIAPSYENLSFSQNHNAGEICKQVGGNSHKSSDFPGYFPSVFQGSGDFNRAVAGTSSPGYGTAGTPGHGGGGINMVFTEGGHPVSHGSGPHSHGFIEGGHPVSGGHHVPHGSGPHSHGSHSPNVAGPSHWGGEEDW